MLAADSRISFSCCFFFKYVILLLSLFCACLCNSVKHILGFNYFQGEEGQLFHYYQSNATPIGVYKMQIADCTQAVLECRSSTD